MREIQHIDPRPGRKCNTEIKEQEREREQRDQRLDRRDKTKNRDLEREITHRPKT